MRSPVYLSQIGAHGSGIAIQNINAKKLGSIKVPIPPLNEQKRIVSKIEELQARSRRAREALETVPDLLEQLRQSILASAFRGDLTKEWRKRHRNVEPASELLKRIRAERRKRWEAAELEKLKAKGLTGDKLDEAFAKQCKKYKEPVPVDTSDLPELPKGWFWASLSELSSAVNSVGYGVLQPGEEVKGGVKFVRVCDLQDGHILTENLRTISSGVDSQYARTRLQGGELLVSVVGTIGRLAVVPSEIVGANIARAIARVVSIDSVNVYWLFNMLSSPFLQDWLTRGAREVARKTLNVAVLEKAPIPLAPSIEQQEILDRIENLIAFQKPKETTVGVTISWLAQLDQSILLRAFRGELAPQDPNDEPASALLERIRAKRAAVMGREQNGKLKPKGVGQ